MEGVYEYNSKEFKRKYLHEIFRWFFLVSDTHRKEPFLINARLIAAGKASSTYLS